MTTYRITPLDRADCQVAGCFAEHTRGKPCNQQHCNASRLARYRLDLVNQATGEVLRSTLACVNHAAWLAHQVGVAFPVVQPSVADRRAAA